MSKRTRNIVIILGALALLIVVAIVASRGKHADVAEVRIEKLAYTTFTTKLPENGVVMHERAATIPALVGGNLGQIFVQAGSIVGQGELLATIYNPTIEYNAAGSQADYASANANISASQGIEQSTKVGNQAQVATNKSALDLAKRVYDEDVTLYANKAIPRSQLDADKASLDQKQVAYDQSVQQLRLGAISGYNGGSVQAAVAAAEKSRILNDQNQQQAAFLQIRAPFAGIIQSVTPQTSDALRPLQPGDQIVAGQAVFTIAGGRGYIVRAQVDEQDIINVRLGMPVLVTGQDFPGKTIHGHISAIAPIATKSTDASSTAKQVLTTIQLDENPPFLRDGMSADVDILTTNIPRSIVIPNDAIFKDKDKSFVYVVADGTAKKRAVTTGKTGDSKTLITSGLAAGDVIIAEKSLGLTDGAKVKAAPSASPMPSPSAT
jgi:RND family efflux transporter MFP subunit